MKTETERTDGASPAPEAPSYSVWPARLVIASDKSSDRRTLESDFAEAGLSNTDTRESLVRLLIYLAPKDRFSKGLSHFSADVWILACTFSVIPDEWSLSEVSLSDEDDLVVVMVSCLCILPWQWWDMWQAKGKFFQRRQASHRALP